jgi:uncharacterized protein YyaL (SSP411 family)
MLYDQALLALAYLEAFQATRKPEYARTASEILEYVSFLGSGTSAFYAAQDADERYYTAADRTKLPRPAYDTKILTDWNGLMIAALAYAANVLHEPKFARRAALTADAVDPKRRPFLDDYAFLIWGLLNLYEATFDIRHLERAIALTDESIRLFRDASGRFYITSKDAAPLLVRPRETGDGAIPSGSSVQLMNLIRLARITAKPEYERYANELMRAAADEVSLAPSTATHFLSALAFHLGPSYEVVLSGRDVGAMRTAVFDAYQPHKVVVHRPPGKTPPIAKIAPYTLDQRPLGDKPTAYVCTNYMCRLPVTDPAKVWQ